MSAPMIKQLPISLQSGGKRDLRSQFAALCYMIKDGKLRILLTTSRRTKRWIVPKGWPMDAKTPGECAAQEAWEEAGVVGKVTEMCLGLYTYRKEIKGEEDLPCVAMVYPIEVKKLKKDFPEASERKRKWVSRKKAAQMVMEPELARIIRDFDPRMLR